MFDPFPPSACAPRGSHRTTLLSRHLSYHPWNATWKSHLVPSSIMPKKKPPIPVYLCIFFFVLPASLQFRDTTWSLVKPFVRCFMSWVACTRVPHRTRRIGVLGLVHVFYGFINIDMNILPKNHPGRRCKFCMLQIIFLDSIGLGNLGTSGALECSCNNAPIQSDNQDTLG